MFNKALLQCLGAGITAFLLLANSESKKTAASEVAVSPVVTNLDELTDFRFTDDGIWISEKKGALRFYSQVTARVTAITTLGNVATQGELGLLSLAIDEPAAKVWIYYNRQTSKADEFTSTLAQADIKRFNPPQLSTFRTVLEFTQYDHANVGGQIQLSGDYLYLGFGDNNLRQRHLNSYSQDLTTYQGKILRLKRDCNASCIPKDNPLSSRRDSSKSEIFAWGFRNPWRMSFDHLGRLLVGDVGEGRLEEISWVRSGKNFGWPYFEGHKPLLKMPNPPIQTELPLITYGRDKGACVIGGYENIEAGTKFYRHYIFGDYLSRNIFAFPVRQKITDVDLRVIGTAPEPIISFSRSKKGTIYVASANTISRLH